VKLFHKDKLLNSVIAPGAPLKVKDVFPGKKKAFNKERHANPSSPFDKLRASADGHIM
jgi:hypothetical protein